MTLKRKILLMFVVSILLTFAAAWTIFRTTALEQLTAQLEGLRVTLIETSGKVFFDSVESADKMENHANRAEVRAALTGRGENFSTRYSETRKSWMGYYAQKISSPQGEFVLRLASPLSELEGHFAQRGANFFWWIASLGIALFLFGLWLTRRLFSPIENIVKLAGEMDTVAVKFPLQGDTEIQHLANALNEMGKRLNDAHLDIERRRAELSRIVESLPVGVLLTDSFNKIRYINTVACSLLGETSEVKKGGLVERLLPNREMNEMLKENEPSAKVFHFPQRAQYVGVSAVGVSGGKLLVLRDLTQEKNLEEIRRNFIIDAGHEFQTPLTIIRMAAELLSQTASPSADETSQKNLRNIIKAQERMSELVDELLMLTRSDAEMGNAEQVDVNEMLRSIISKLRSIPAAQGAKIELETNGDAVIFAPPTELERAFSNVIENAVKYSQERENPRVKITSARDGGKISVRIEDNGVGISDELGSQIFEPFRRGDAARGATHGSPGYGLGLSISKRIFEGLGGQILLEKNVGEGAAFLIYL